MINGYNDDMQPPYPSPPGSPDGTKALDLATGAMPIFDSDILVSEEERQFCVFNPQDNGSYVLYDVRGADSSGVWEGKRRYNEFFTLRETLVQRFIAIPIPFLPEKKIFGNKDINFLQDRTFYLQRFLQKLTRYPYILESPEFLTFSRPKNDLGIEKTLKNLTAMTTMQKYKRLRDVTHVDE